MSKNKNKRLVLLDAHAIIHRAYHALPDFTSGDTGEPTGALYGLSAMLLKIVKDLKPDYIAAYQDRSTSYAAVGEADKAEADWLKAESLSQRNDAPESK